MTKPRYLRGCTAGSKVRGRAWAGDRKSNAWYVNLNNGNANINDQNNKGLALPVCGPVSVPGECQGIELFQPLWQAWRRMRRKKRPSRGQIKFESRLLDNLFWIERRLIARTWSAKPSACFIAKRPKAREIHAPDYADRVVHHMAVPPLEERWEPRFIHDSYSNRKGKGAHAAVYQVQRFMRQVQSGQGDGWVLQLDIKNCFNSIDRRRLFAEMKHVLQKGGASPLLIWIVRELLRQSAAKQGVRHFSSARERAQVPAHKRLENAAAGCGLAIGNLSSQFFANVYLDKLDQFVKHVLKAKRYARYVDDLVIVHQDRDQLLEWQRRIEEFLQRQLGLELKAKKILKPIRSGCDFLGYIVYPTHLRVRPRVIHHAREALQAWQARHVRGSACHGTPDDFRRVQATWSSVLGHIRHARSWRVRQRLQREFPWLRVATARRQFHPYCEGKQLSIPWAGAA